MLSTKQQIQTQCVVDLMKTAYIVDQRMKDLAKGMPLICLEEDYNRGEGGEGFG